MDSSIVVAIISGVFTLLVVVMTIRMSNAKLAADLDKSDAVQNEKIDNLAKAIEKQSQKIEKINVDLPQIRQEFSVMDNRIANLEKKVEKLEEHYE